MRPRWISPSSQSQFNNCERQWYYKRVLKKPEPPSFYLSIGNLYHAVLEELVQHGETLDLEDTVDVLYARFAAQPDWTCPTTEVNLKKEILRNMHRVQEEILAPLWNGGAELQSEKVYKYMAKVDVVTSKRPIINMGEITGLADEAGVLDWKVKFNTNKRRSDADAENSEQLAMYAVLEDVRWCAFVEIPRTSRAPLSIIAKHYDDDEIAWWTRYFDEVTETVASRKDRSNGETIEEIEPRFRLAHPSLSLCDPRWCPYWGECPGGGR